MELNQTQSEHGDKGEKLTYPEAMKSHSNLVCCALSPMEKPQVKTPGAMVVRLASASCANGVHRSPGARQLGLERR